MLPTRWDPFRELARGFGTLPREFEELFRRNFGGEEGTLSEGQRMPLINTYVKDEILHVDAELPGVKSDDLDVSIEGRVLTIRTETSRESKVEEENYLMRESSTRTFLRRLDLPETANTAEIHANFENGILRLTMPVTKTIEGRKIEIETGKKKVH